MRRTQEAPAELLSGQPKNSLLRSGEEEVTRHPQMGSRWIPLVAHGFPDRLQK